MHLHYLHKWQAGASEALEDAVHGHLPGPVRGALAFCGIAVLAAAVCWDLRRRYVRKML
jgi:hypothetical protein